MMKFSEYVESVSDVAGIFDLNGLDKKKIDAIFDKQERNLNISGAKSVKDFGSQNYAFYSFYEGNGKINSIIKFIEKEYMYGKTEKEKTGSVSYV